MILRHQNNVQGDGNALYVLISAAARSSLARSYIEQITGRLFQALPAAVQKVVSTAATVADSLARADAQNSLSSWPNVQEESVIDPEQVAEDLKAHTEKAAASADDILRKITPLKPGEAS